jgi:hypothetical protein
MKRDLHLREVRALRDDIKDITYYKREACGQWRYKPFTFYALDNYESEA